MDGGLQKDFLINFLLKEEDLGQGPPMEGFPISLAGRLGLLAWLGWVSLADWLGWPGLATLYWFP